MKYKITSMILLIVCACTVLAQQPGTDPGIEQLKKMNDQYKKCSYLQFDMDFRYSTESAPDKYLDSMKGVAKISGNHYSYILGNTELIKTEEYLVSIFSEEKIMQLVKLRRSDSSSPMDANGINTTLINALDSMQQRKLVTITSTEVSGLVKITVQFSDHPSWKSVEYVIRKSDGFLDRTVIIAKMEEMLGPGLQEMELVDGYAIIETIFSNYSSQSPDTASLQGSRYFTRNGDQFEPADTYKEYRIMVVQ
jgi:hypothetical protein